MPSSVFMSIERAFEIWTYFLCMKSSQWSRMISSTYGTSSSRNSSWSRRHSRRSRAPTPIGSSDWTALTAASTFCIAKLPDEAISSFVELLVEDFLELEFRQLQQLDRLLQRRRHDQLLGEFEVEFLF